MKTIRITYWITTLILALAMIYTASTYFTKPEMAQAFTHLGFPSYFRIELGIAKLIGSIVLIIPAIGKLKEWAYAGFTITFISAIIATTALNDPLETKLKPIIFLSILIVSYYTHYKMKRAD